MTAGESADTMHRTPSPLPGRDAAPAVPHRYALPIVREIPAAVLHERQLARVVASLTRPPREAR